MTAEREKLVQSLEQISTKVEEVRKSTYEKDVVAQRKVEGIEKLITMYNTLGYRIGIIPGSGPNVNGVSFELDFNVQVAQGEERAGQVRLDQLINQDLRHEIRGALAKLREQFGGDVHKKQDEAIQLQEQLDHIVEALVDKRDELEGLEAKVAAVMEQHSEIKDVLSFLVRLNEDDDC
jgi:kinetochore protein NDC80